MALKTRSVIVWRSTIAGKDPLGSPIKSWEAEEVEGCLIQPSGTADLVEALRPEGITVAATVHFPKGYGKSLRGCEIEIPGGRFPVVGDPIPYMEENTPGRWNMQVPLNLVKG